MSETSVLLVDDRPDNLLALQAVLAPLGCSLVTAHSGDAALRALLRDDFAVIVLDVQMPGLDGFETAELIRSRERTRLVPIIFVTAVNSQPQHVFRGYAAGAVDYVIKPLDPLVLRSKVELFVELARRREELAMREALLLATFEDAPVGMARTGAEGRLLQVNAALGATLGRPPAELVGLTLDELGPPADVGLDAPQRADLLAGRGSNYAVERRLNGVGGAEVPVLVSVARTAVGDRRPDLVVHVQDLTDRKRAESRRVQLIRAQSARSQAEATAERLRITESIAAAALGASSVGELARELLDRIVEELGVDSAAITLDGDRGERIVARAGGVEVEPHAAAGATADEVFARLRAERAPLILRDVAGSGVGPGVLGQDVVSLLAVPLVIDGEVLGSLQIGTYVTRVFDAEAADLLRLAADHAGLAIARTRLHERERRIAGQLQLSLLPKRLPDVPGLAMSARYQPGADGTQVGGDWYDAVALPGGGLAFAVGDVVGRGIEAAATMGQLRSALRAFIMWGEHTGAIANRLNEFALGLSEALMTTVVIAVLEPATGRLRFTSAGHLPPLVASAANGCHLVEHPPSPPLGVLDAPCYPEHEVTLEPGAAFVLYTDGLVERRGEALDAGLRRLTDACAATEDDVEALADRVVREVQPAGGANDDVTLLVVRALIPPT